MWVILRNYSGNYQNIAIVKEAKTYLEAIVEFIKAREDLLPHVIQLKTEDLLEVEDLGEPIQWYSIKDIRFGVQFVGHIIDGGTISK